MTRLCALVAILTLAPSKSFAQSVNVDFGTAGPVPAATYAAAGLPGAWNPIGVLPPAQRAPLVGLDGAATPAKIYMIGGTALFAADDPGTSGDDEALVDDMLIGFNDPVDVCVWFEGLANGDYEVILYGITPDDPVLTNRVRVDFAVPGPTIIGGAWPGGHVESITYQTFTVTVTDGTIGLHAGDWDLNAQAGLNGIQVVSLGDATGAGVAPAPGGTAIRRVFPNPASAGQRIELEIVGRPEVVLEIFDVAGRLVWSTDLGRLAPGTRSITWDGRDRAGRPVPSAVYFARLAGVAYESPTKLVRVD